MKNVLICWVIAAVILVAGLFFINTTAAKYTNIDVEIVNVVPSYHTRTYVVDYKYYNTISKEMVYDKIVLQEEDYIFAPKVGDEMKITVFTDTHMPTENVTFNEGMFRMVVYGFGGFFILGGFVNLIFGVFIKRNN